jgi:glycosyltransferase involved in cell wall biosynthesis
MRILVIPPSDYLGHPNPCRLHHIFERISQQGDDVYVARFSLYENAVRRTNTTIISLGDRKINSLPLYYLLNAGAFVRSLVDAVKKYDIEIALLANLYPPYLLGHFMSERVVRVVDLLDHYPKVAGSNVPALFPKRAINAMFEGMMRSIIKGSDVTTACSYALAEYARKNGARNVHRIPNGVDESFLCDYEKEGHEIRRKLGLSERDIVLCYVGNVEYWLNLEELLLAIRSIKKNMGKSIKFLLVGGKLRTAYSDRLNNLVNSLGLNEAVLRVGFVPHEEVPKYIAAGDIGLIPKNMEDPVSSYSFPLKLWEYLAQGKPVISTSLPEVLLVARDVVSIADTQSQYVSCIANFLDDPETFLREAQEGRNLAKQHTWNKIATDYRALLKSIC